MGIIDMPSMDSTLSESSGSPLSSTPDARPEASSAKPQKRSADAAGLKPNGPRPAKSVKRRASKACQCCRARKVRCNVVEHGAPCTNCRLDEVECIVSESKRKKKWPADDVPAGATASQGGNSNGNGNGNNKPTTTHAKSPFPTSARPPYEPLKRAGDHVPHALYQDLGQDFHPSPVQQFPQDVLLHRLGQRANSMPQPAVPVLSNLIPPLVSTPTLPAYIRPLPSRLADDDVSYLHKKGALSIPDTQLRDELLRSFVEFCYPLMPLVDIHDLVGTIDANNGKRTVSLLLFQAILFAGVAAVDMRYLKAAGYATRKDARRQFFQRTRLLYDFDYESDRVTLIQALLIMSHWYETPDDQKDSHHWMGIAVSLAHSIGLHRNADRLEPARRRLWKRMWWSIYMRDRLIALGMRRPTRVTDSDFDVPMLTLDDFEIRILHDGPSCIPEDSKLLRTAELQRRLAVLCIEKAKLCVCISRVLSVQYSGPQHRHGSGDEAATRATPMVMAERADAQTDDVLSCDRALLEWRDNLDSEARYEPPSWHDIDSGNEPAALSLSLLHMVYYAAVSALHRPQVLPSSAMPARPNQADAQLEVSRRAVRLASSEITSITSNLNDLDLVRLLPTSGITVLLPAIIIQLLDIKAADEAIRRSSLQGFCQCMQAMVKLRDIYSAADYSTAFLEAAIRKAEITLPQKSNEVKEPRNIITSAQGLVDAGNRMRLLDHPGMPGSTTLTPPPDDHVVIPASNYRANVLSDEEIGRRLKNYLASTPPDSESHTGSEVHEGMLADLDGIEDVDMDFDALIDIDGSEDSYTLDSATLDTPISTKGDSGIGFSMSFVHGIAVPA